jgi:hypothetical protein
MQMLHEFVVLMVAYLDALLTKLAEAWETNSW